MPTTRPACVGKGGREGRKQTGELSLLLTKVRSIDDEDNQLLRHVRNQWRSLHSPIGSWCTYIPAGPRRSLGEIDSTGATAVQAPRACRSKVRAACSAVSFLPACRRAGLARGRKTGPADGFGRCPVGGGRLGRRLLGEGIVAVMIWAERARDRFRRWKEAAQCHRCRAVGSCRRRAS